MCGAPGTLPGEQRPVTHEGSVSVSTAGKSPVQGVRPPFQGPGAAWMCLLVLLKKRPGVLSTCIEADFPK